MFNKTTLTSLVEGYGKDKESLKQKFVSKVKTIMDKKETEVMFVEEAIEDLKEEQTSLNTDIELAKTILKGEK